MVSDSDNGDTSWDFFIAHASADSEPAERLYERLTARKYDPVRVFLDTRSLRLGDDWDTAIGQAQQSSRITVVLVSTNSPSAYYQREEIAAAVAMAREDQLRHRVVPVLLGKAGVSVLPHGLRLKHGLRVARPEDMNSAAADLLDLLGDVTAVRPETLVRRAQGVARDNDRASDLSLRSLTESTSNGVKAIRGFLGAIEDMVRAGTRVADIFADRRERDRLRELLLDLVNLGNHQAPLPMMLRSHNPRDWTHIACTLAALTPKVARATELLAEAAGGPFIQSAQEAYQSLLFSLQARSQVYAKIESLPPPNSAEDFAELAKIAEQYEVLIAELGHAERAIIECLAG